MKAITEIERGGVEQYEDEINQHGKTILNPTKLGIEYHNGKMQVVMDCEPVEAGMLLANLITNLITDHGKEFTGYTTEVVTHLANTIVRAQMPKELRSIVDHLESDTKNSEDNGND
ncbi:hypothetical protein ACRYI5_00990 [Furfurilactobacillus sp. WILCCON 0119]